MRLQSLRMFRHLHSFTVESYFDYSPRPDDPFVYKKLPQEGVHRVMAGRLCQKGRRLRWLT